MSDLKLDSKRMVLIVCNHWTFDEGRSLLLIEGCLGQGCSSSCALKHSTRKAKAVQCTASLTRVRLLTIILSLQHILAGM